MIFVLYSIEVLLLTWTYFYVLSDQKWLLHALLNSKRTESVKVQMEWCQHKTLQKVDIESES